MKQQAKQVVPKGSRVMIKQEQQQQSTIIAKSGSLKAAKMTIPVVISKWGVNNEFWARTLQLYSDYLIRY